MTPPPLRIVVADDQRAVREALATVLDAEPGFEVVGLAADGEEAVELAHRLSPAVVLMDLRMPNVDGVAATRRLAAELPDVKVVVLTTFADDASIIAASRPEQLGFLTKDAGREQIALAVRSAAAGQAVLDPVVQASLCAPRHRRHGSGLKTRAPRPVEPAAPAAQRRSRRHPCPTT
jgi:DNA-binding NarL/FixJ family response regulator